MSAASATHVDSLLARSVALAEQRRELLDAGIRSVLDRAVALWERVVAGIAFDPDEAAAIYGVMTVLDRQVQGVQRSVRGSLDLGASVRTSPGLLATISAAASTAATVASSLNAALHCLAPRPEPGDSQGRGLSACLQMAVGFLRTSLQASATLATEMSQAVVLCPDVMGTATKAQS